MGPPPTRISSWDESTVASMMSGKDARVGKGALCAESRSTESESGEERLALQRYRPRRSIGVRLSEWAAAEKVERERRQSLTQVEGGPDDAARRLEGIDGCGDDEGGWNPSAGIQTAVVQDRSGIQSRKSMKALRFWDTVAQRVEEEHRRSVHEDVPATSKKRRSSTFGGPPRATPSRNAERRHSRVRRPSYSVASEASSGVSQGSFCGSQISLYPCPFRRRNPARFNIRDHEHCTRTSKSMLDLRHHILALHQRQRPAHQCRRCWLEFNTHHQLDSHLMAPKETICELKSPEPSNDPEDGISDSVERTLRGSAAADDWDWASLWLLLFPMDDGDIPEPDLHPVVELVEVEQALDEGREGLKNDIQDKLHLLLPDTVERSYSTFLAGQLDLVVEIHHSNILRRCLAKVTSPPTPQAHARSPSRPAPPKHNDGTIKRISVRRSRRSIMLSVRPTPKPEPSSELAKEVSFIKVSPRLLEDLGRDSEMDQNNNSLLSRPLPRSSATSTPFSCGALTNCVPPNTRAPSISPDDRDDDEYAAAARESRDSGISIPCDVCESEVCHCRDIAMSVEKSCALSFSPSPPGSRDTEQRFLLAKDSIEILRGTQQNDTNPEEHVYTRPSSRLPLPPPPKDGSATSPDSNLYRRSFTPASPQSPIMLSPLSTTFPPLPMKFLPLPSTLSPPPSTLPPLPTTLHHLPPTPLEIYTTPTDHPSRIKGRGTPYPLKKLPHQPKLPKLRLQTSDIGLGIHLGGGGGSAVEPSSADGGFSPQSFKQRVLRKEGAGMRYSGVSSSAV